MSFMSHRPSRDDSGIAAIVPRITRGAEDREYDDTCVSDEYVSPQDIRGTRAAPCTKAGAAMDFTVCKQAASRGGTADARLARDTIPTPATTMGASTSDGRQGQRPRGSGSGDRAGPGE